MTNPLLAPEERSLTPDQVEALDKRRDLGQALLVIAGVVNRWWSGPSTKAVAPPGNVIVI